MQCRRSAGFEDLPPHLAAAIVQLAFHAEGRRLLPWLQLSLVSKCVRCTIAEPRPPS